MPDPQFAGLLTLMYGYLPPELWADYDREAIATEDVRDRPPGPMAPNGGTNHRLWTSLLAIGLLLCSGLTLLSHRHAIGTHLSERAVGIGAELGRISQ
jgi:hypothetical protein